VLLGTRALGGQHLVEPEVGRVRERRLVIGHGAVATASKWRCAPGASAS
jgi:hypothetical protein